jgi:hypothetical protein
VRNRCVALLGAAVVTFVSLLSGSIAAQQSPSGIAGLVRDASGAVLPGVTVEAASPALIEKVRSVVSDGEGRYRIVDLRPGTYVVTFSLTGFSSFRREGIELTAGFTATVNADMKVGGLEETITVTGENPQVDTQNIRQQKVLSHDVLSTLPTGQTSVVNLIALTPGMTGNATVGGSTGAYHSGQTKGTFHGKKGTHILFDGMRIDNYAGGGDSPGYLFNQQTVEESAIESGGAGAESDAPNVNINMIPKDGSNTFRYIVSGLYTNNHLQSSNLTDALRARGLTTNSKVVGMYDIGLTVGGPIKKDALWFFSAIRRWGVENQAAGLFWNKTQGTSFYTPDVSRPAARKEKYQSHATRVTWQASSKNKVNFFFDLKSDCICETGGAGSALGAGATNAQEAVESWHLWPNGAVMGTWSAPLTNKLLLEAGGSIVMFHWPGYLAPGVSADSVSILEQSTNFRFNNPGMLPPDRRMGDRYSQRFAASYITGSHAFKIGVQQNEGFQDTITIGLGLPEAKGVSYTFNRGVPVSLTERALPQEVKFFQKAELGIFAQDQWTLKRLTLNYGLRFEYYNGYVPAVHLPAAQFVPARDFDAIHGAPSWQDWDPRVGASYDVFGDGRTAFKVSFGRYVAMSGDTIVSQYHPVNTSVNSVDRQWTDANANYYPDCDLANFSANDECGPIANQNFGKNDPNAKRFANDVRNGWGIRPFTWDVGTEVQHQIGPGVSVTVGYYHNWDGNFLVTDNVAVTAASYSPYCITAPIDARLPGGGGYQVCGLYDVNPDKFGVVTNLVTQSLNFGKQRRINDFFGVGLDMRFGRGLRLAGGVDAGRTVEDVCYDVDSPGAVAVSLPGASAAPIPHTATTINGQRTCRTITPLRGTLQVKANGSYPLPAGFVVAATYQNLPGLSYTATYNATTAEIAPSLGRNLAGATRTAAAPLIAPQTLFEARRTQIDLRLTKSFRLGGERRLQANFDVYNALNADSILGENNTFGSSWRKPTLVLGGRLIQFSSNLSF